MRFQQDTKQTSYLYAINNLQWCVYCSAAVSFCRDEWCLCACPVRAQQPIWSYSWKNVVSNL